MSIEEVRSLGANSVPCHDYVASWPREPAKFRLLARGFPGSLNELLHVSTADSWRGCDA